MSRILTSAIAWICCRSGFAAADFRRGKEERGSAILEFTFVLILFLTMLFAIAGFGHALYAYHFVSNAAKSAARWASVNGATCGPNLVAGTPLDGSCNGTGGMNNGPASSSDIATYVTSIVPLGIDSDPSKLTTTATWPVQANSPPICSAAVAGVGPTPNAPGCTVEVTVSYNFNFIFPLISTNPLTVSSSSEMVVVH